MVDAKGLDVQVTVGWWERVRARHPNLTLRNGESLSQARMKAIDQVVLDTYFNLLHHILVSNNLLNKPAHLFNSDETGFPLCHKTGKVIIDKKQKHPYRAASAWRQNSDYCAGMCKCSRICHTTHGHL
jgi:hypothetical protein